MSYRLIMAAVAAVGALAVPAAALEPPPAGAAPAGAALPWLHVEHPPGQLARIADAQGRTVLLRGVNVAGLEDDYYLTGAGNPQPVAPFYPVEPAAYDGTCPANSRQMDEPPLCEIDAGAPEYAQSSAADSRNDFAQMRALGFNVVRLALSWSLLEPQPGVYDQTYLDRVTQVVGWAGEQGIHVLLDMHQDDYSRFIPQTSAVSLPPLLTVSPGSPNHADGAPPWAVMTDGVPPLAPAGEAQFNLAAAAAFTSFWLDRTPTGAGGSALPQGAAPGPGLQDHYIGAMAALARRFVGNSTVVGYEIMNEPLPGVVAPGVFDEGFLHPFYRRVIDAITGVRDGLPCPPSLPALAVCGYPDLGVHDTRHLFFFEPMVLRNLTDVAVGTSLPFTTYPQIVYAPHVYTHVFTLDTTLGLPSNLFPLSYDQAYDTAALEAKLMGAALFIGEYGNSASQDEVLLAPQTAAQDRHLASSTIWLWKANCLVGASPGTCADGIWSTYSADPATPPAQNGELLPSRVRYLSRAYPQATAGRLTSLRYDPATAAFTMTATSDGQVAPGDRARESVVYVPATVAGAMSVTGGAVLDAVLTNPDGSRLGYVAPTGTGAYGVSVAGRSTSR